MNRLSVKLVAAILAFSIFTGCGTTDVKPTKNEYAGLSATLNGSGSSFQDTFQQKVKTAFTAQATGVTINYTKSGSKAGKQDLANNTVKFAGTDSLVKKEELPAFKGGDILYFPIAAAPITVSYKVNGVKELKLSADVLAKIFQGEITNWNDPAINSENGGKLPSEAITVVHRSDGSGTTSNFTKFLTAASGGVWKLSDGDTVAWPASTQGAEKNSGVAKVISTTEGAIGYVDLSDAVVNNLDLAQVKNASGNYVAPTLDASSAALANVVVADDLTYNPLNAAGDKSYPITAPTWVLVYKNQVDAKQRDALKGYLKFILTDGQKLAQGVGYSKLPDALAKKALDNINLIK